MFFVVTLYPLLLLSGLIIAVVTTAVIVAIALCLSLLLPFISVCVNMDLVPNETIRQNCGCCIILLLIIVFYPFFYVVNFVQIAYQILEQEGTMVFRPLIELAHGVKLIFLFPCLMMVDNSDYYLSTAQVRDDNRPGR